MDPDISRWLAEFQLRSSAPDSVVADFLKSLNLSKPDNKLKKTLLLRILQSEITNASITEEALEVLEEIEAIDGNDAVPLLDFMRTAYCAIAVECTVKYLSATSDGVPSKEYLAAMARIWFGRVLKLEHSRSKLFSYELAQWMENIEAAVVDTEIYQRLAKLNTRYDAFSAVRVYLQKVWETMGPCFLDTLAEMTFKGMKKESASSVLLMEGVGLNGGHEGKEQLEERAEGSVDGTQEPAKGEKASQKGDPQLKRKLPAFLRCHRGVNKSIAEELGTEHSGSKNGTEFSAEVKVAEESLPEALNVSDAVGLKLAQKGTNQEGPMENMSVDVDVPNLNTSRAIVLFQPNNADHEKKSSVHHSRVQVQCPNLMEENNTAHESSNLMEQNSTAHEIPNLMEQNSTAHEIPNLMEQNGTAHEIPNLMEQNGTAHEIPNLMEQNSTAHESPNSMEKNSTTRRYKRDNSKDNPTGVQLRRKQRRWSPMEEDALRIGVEKFGSGNWKAILSFYSNIFQDRKAIDLKDKWRNLMR
ncbi:uncharacterized protein LOC107476251 [Arachis duranensis]|uniref:Uncharacterized protein LOC107476251 n=1 Tax=Arachis duranensis TaxID=130453 RepID=A0A6P4CHZ3_ARADU|nr:uncharacterized protein LOC107476251 [Arachis duranensis]